MHVATFRLHGHIHISSAFMSAFLGIKGDFLRIIGDFLLNNGVKIEE